MAVYPGDILSGSSNKFSNLLANVYTISATDVQSSCPYLISGATTRNVTINPAPSKSFVIRKYTNLLLFAAAVVLQQPSTSNNASCFSTKTGDVSVSASGGTAPYSYNVYLNNATTAANTTSSTVIDTLYAGEYRGQAVDSHGCLSNNVTFQVGQPEGTTAL